MPRCRHSACGNSKCERWATSTHRRQRERRRAFGDLVAGAAAHNGAATTKQSARPTGDRAVHRRSHNHDSSEPATASSMCRYVWSGVGVVVPASSTLRDEMAVSGQSRLAAIAQILMAAHTDILLVRTVTWRSLSRVCGGPTLFDVTLVEGYATVSDFRMPEPWERQRDEPPKALQAFRTYRDLGSRRTHTKVAEACKVSESMVHRWASVWNWTERVRAWDDEQDRVAREATLADIADMHRRHAQLAVALLNKAAFKLIGDDAQGITPLDPNKLTARDIAVIMEAGVKLERTARGEAVTRVAVTQEIEATTGLAPADEDERTAEALAALIEAGVPPPAVMCALVPTGVGSDGIIDTSEEEDEAP